MLDYEVHWLYETTTYTGHPFSVVDETGTYTRFKKGCIVKREKAQYIIEIAMRNL